MTTYLKIELAPAVAKLRRYMASPPRITQVELASALGRKQPLVSAWLKGIARPSGVLRKLLENLTSGAVPAIDWMLSSERAELRRAGLAGRRIRAKRAAA